MVYFVMGSDWALLYSFSSALPCYSLLFLCFNPTGPAKIKWEAGRHFMLLTRFKNTIVWHRLSLVQVILVLLAVTEKTKIEVTLLLSRTKQHTNIITHNHNMI